MVGGWGPMMGPDWGELWVGRDRFQYNESKNNSSANVRVGPSQPGPARRAMPVIQPASPFGAGGGGWCPLSRSGGKGGRAGMGSPPPPTQLQQTTSLILRSEREERAVDDRLWRPMGLLGPQPGDPLPEGKGGEAAPSPPP